MAQQPIVKITLVKPFNGDPNAIVHVRGGQVSFLDDIASGDARVDSRTVLSDPAMWTPFNQDPAARQRAGGDLEEIDLHQDVDYQLRWNEDEEIGRTVLVPFGTARTNFGDWELVPGARRRGQSIWQTYDRERMRVANKWGGYALFPFTRVAPNGREIADPRRIGPPVVPHVTLAFLDPRGNETGATFDPHKFYKWEQLVDRNAAVEAARRLKEQGYDAANALIEHGRESREGNVAVLERQSVDVADLDPVQLAALFEKAEKLGLITRNAPDAPPPKKGKEHG